MILHLFMELDNAAFHEGKWTGEDYDVEELRRCLIDVAEKIAFGRKESKILDINGNNVGDWEVRKV